MAGAAGGERIGARGHGGPQARSGARKWDHEPHRRMPSISRMNQTRICLKEETETTTGMPTQKIQQRRVRAGQRRVRQGNHHPAPPATCTRTHTWTRRGESKAGKTDRPRGQAGPDQTKAGRRRQDGRKTTDPPSKAPLTAGREGGGAEEGRDR